jgi:hypothetical protein
MVPDGFQLPVDLYTAKQGLGNPTQFLCDWGRRIKQIFHLQGYNNAQYGPEEYKTNKHGKM